MLTDDEVYARFRRARWPEGEGRVPWCAHRGCEGAWELSRRWFKGKQREYRREFTVTSGSSSLVPFCPTKLRM